MIKTPSYLKGLAETRARAAGDVLRLERLQGEVTEALEKARFEVQACDALIKKFDQRLDPRRIEPIQARVGRYGKHGALKASILRYLQEAFPQEVSTTEIAVRLQAELGLDFPTPAACEQWVHNCVRAQLRAFVKQGYVERTAEVKGELRSGRWRSTTTT